LLSPAAAVAAPVRLNRLSGTLRLWLMLPRPRPLGGGCFGVAGARGLDEFESDDDADVDEDGGEEQELEDEGSGGAIK
jgi:hypothetical protein